MAITTNAELLAAVAAWSNRTDLTSVIPDFVVLCEAALQTKCKLLEFETTATVTITSGTGTLPTGFVAMRSVYWDASPDRAISYITPDEYDALRVNDSGDGYYYTISGSTIRTMPMGSGSVVCTYSAKFTALASGVNAILTNFPDAYLFGSLFQLALYTDDEEAMKKYGTLFNAACERINQNDQDRRYAGASLQVRAR